jgi:hypothetical protein
VDEAVLARLGSNPNLHVNRGYVTAIKDPLHPVTVTLPMPYIHYTSAVGDDDNRRLTARRMRRSVPFYLTYVGETEEQTKAAGEAARDLLERWVPTISGHTAWPCKVEESQRVRRDDASVNTEGQPLFYGVDGYAVSIQLAPVLAI